MERKCEISCGCSGTGETPQAFTPRRLTARPAESEHLEGKSTTPHYLVNSNKVCEKQPLFFSSFLGRYNLLYKLSVIFCTLFCPR
ncbi:hypothetical protein RCO48_11600 [Peribacillus frigoritolerans]|nr:hypothetical protein [Peribacillus frigoritolerans]